MDVPKELDEKSHYPIRALYNYGSVSVPRQELHIRAYAVIFDYGGRTGREEVIVEAEELIAHAHVQSIVHIAPLYEIRENHPRNGIDAQQEAIRR